MREIAKAASISAPALYNHFDSKEALYQATVSAAFADKAEKLHVVLNNQGKPIERLGGFVLLMAESLREDPCFCNLMQRELLDGDESRMGFLSQKVFNPVAESLVTLMNELRPGCDALLLIELIFGMVKQHDQMRHLHPFLTISGDSQRSPQQITEQIMAVVTPFFSGETQ